MAIDTSLSSLSSLNPYAISSGASGVASSASTTPGNTPDPVASSTNSAALQQAIELASEASVVVTLGGSSNGNGDGLTYNAAGLFNSFVNAGSATGITTDTSQNQADQSLAQGILGSISAPASSSGVYAGNGVFSAQDGLTAEQSALLKSNPGLAATFVGDAVNQGIVGSLISTTA